MAITISVDTSNGNMTIAPSVAYYAQGAVVQWKVTGGTNLTISFKDGTPFATQQLTGPGSVESGILTNATKGVYHYIVAAQVGGTIYVTPGCPEIVVQ